MTWRNQLPQLEGWPLLPCGAGEKGKPGTYRLRIGFSLLGCINFLILKTCSLPGCHFCHKPVPFSVDRLMQVVPMEFAIILRLSPLSPLF